MRDLYSDALRYAERGWSVMPLSKKNKVPIVEWKELQERQPTPEELKEWFERRPNVNMGIVTGELSGVFILESDSPEGLEWILKQGIPRCPMVQSSEPYKRHFYFKHPGFKVKNSASELHPGVDVRGDGGQAVLPPSVHKSGVVYEWIIGLDDVEIPDAPEWLLEKVRKKEFQPTQATPLPSLNGATTAMQKYANAALEGELALVAHAPDGQKHDQLFKSVAKVAEFIPLGLLDEGQVKGLFFDAIQHRAEDKKGALKTIEDAIKRGSQQPRQIPERKEEPLLRRGAARAYVLGASRSEIHRAVEQEDENDGEGADESERAADKGLYAARYGRTLLRIQKSKQTAEGEKEDGELKLVCDLVATIVGESTNEDGQTVYQVQGLTKRRRKFLIEMEASKVNDPKYVASQLKNAAGAGIVLYAGMEKHLFPAIDSFTDHEKLEYSRRYVRVGWTRDGKEFIMPGMIGVTCEEDVKITLKNKLPYEVTPDANLERGLEVLDTLLQAQKIEATTVCLSHLLSGPLALPTRWRDEKYALFIAGRTGSFKSSWAMVAMCLYGPRFQREENLVKFGQGATMNAMMALMTKASDVPFLVDNYKPNTGRGEDDLRNLIHAALEGGEKDRLDRNSQLRDSNPIHCWPIFTGEDVPDKDAASLARALVVHFDWVGADNPNLTKVQDHPDDLCAIGGEWIRWIQSGDAAPYIEIKTKLFSSRRSMWSGKLRKLRDDMVNVSRVASNLAVNELAWEIACCHPSIGAVLRKYDNEFRSGLEAVASNMAQHTAQAFEANRYIEALRGLVAAGRAVLAPKTTSPDAESKAKHIGWEDDKGDYLIPDVAFEEATSLLKNTGGFGNVTKNTIHKQLAQLGFIESTGSDKDRFTKIISCGGRKVRVLHLKAGTISGDSAEAEDE